MRPLWRAGIGLLVLAAGCTPRSHPVEPVAATQASTLPRFRVPGRPAGSVMSYEAMMKLDLGPTPAVTQGFPAQLDDAALAQMYAHRQGFAAFYFERENNRRILWRDLLERQHVPATHYEATALGRFEREHEAHYLRWKSNRPESAATLLALLHAAEATLLYDWELAVHLWTHTRQLRPAPLAVLARLDHHMRVIRALHLGAAVTGPVVWNQESSAIEVPPGLAAAAARAFADADAGTFDTYATLPLTVIRGRVVLVHRGVEQELTEGDGLLLRRLDVIRVPAAATLGHAVLGEFPLAAGSEITAWNVPQFLSPTQRTQIKQLIAAMRAGDRDAFATVEAMLPAAYPDLDETYATNPAGVGLSEAYFLLLKYEGEMAP